jgi:hypothetical protein
MLFLNKESILAVPPKASFQTTWKHVRVFRFRRGFLSDELHVKLKEDHITTRFPPL